MFIRTEPAGEIPDPRIWSHFEMRPALQGVVAGYRRTTNNRMELLAVITGLEAIKRRNADVRVYSDSAYVVKAINEKWIDKWLQKGLHKQKNPDLWERFLNVYKRHNVSFYLIKGHSGQPRK